MMIRTLLLTLALSTTATAWAESFVLPYQSANKWVAQEDKTELAKLMSYAKKEKLHVFDVVLPSETDRALSIARLKVIRDILEQSLGNGVLIVETEGETPSNSLTLRTRD